ncbi:hypothetical protein NDU88_002998 [Pleurodeles waltl]|uniref:Uncharacterized protein n=1 Tax=Pleurodeles waltl TaxID=8319 RepID=A0AAV7NJH9_PLEWA|nr:hypothetical protein NDU88_002998 [Pleurodeles waltl]
MPRIAARRVRRPPASPGRTPQGRRVLCCLNPGVRCLHAQSGPITRPIYALWAKSHSGLRGLVPSSLFCLLSLGSSLRDGLSAPTNTPRIAAQRAYPPPDQRLGVPAHREGIATFLLLWAARTARFSSLFKGPQADSREDGLRVREPADPVQAHASGHR